MKESGTLMMMLQFIDRTRHKLQTKKYRFANNKYDFVVF